MLELRREVDLALESLGADAVCELGGKELHDDEAIEGGFARNEHAAHAAAGELLLETIGVSERFLELTAHVHVSQTSVAGGTGRHQHMDAYTPQLGNDRCAVQVRQIAEELADGKPEPARSAGASGERMIVGQVGVGTSRALYRSASYCRWPASRARFR
jgi:hypothetical protein